METLKISINNQQTKELVVHILHTIKGVNIEETRRSASPGPASALKELSGIWAGRNVTQTELRTKAWHQGSPT